LLATVAEAQQKTAPIGGIAVDIRKVLDDYPNHFDNIKGDIIAENPQTAEYDCRLKISGAEECTITRYKDEQKNIVSWQAVMLTTESFADARNRFRSLFGQLGNLPVMGMRLKGTYETPAEEKKFTSVLFSLDPPDARFKHTKVELVMESEMLEWKVKLLIYDQEKSDEE
jgi:hypothetical protein